MQPLVYEREMDGNANEFRLSERNRHYLGKVMRLAAPARFVCCNGRGLVASATLCPQGYCRLAEKERRERGYRVGLNVVLAQLPDAKLADALRAAAVFGAARIALWRAAKTRAKGGAKSDRWQNVCEDAGRVARLAWLPEIIGPCGLTDCLAAVRGSRLLLMDAAGARLQRSSPPPADGCALIIGPESGLTDAEKDAWLAAGAEKTALGPFVLRVEQAVLAALAVFRHEMEDGAVG